MTKFDEIIQINENKLTNKYIELLSYEERENLVEPIFSFFREEGFKLPLVVDFEKKLKKSYSSLLNYKPDINNLIQDNNNSMATDICKYFCHSFYTSVQKPFYTFEQVFNDDVKLKKLIRNRIGMDWYDEVNEAFNLSHRMLIQGMRSMRLVGNISIFKPSIAKFMCERYSNPGDLVGDYSCGFGARMLGAVTSGRRYIGTDPLTVDELEDIVKFFNIDGVELIKSGSENYIGEENSVDFYWSSPPYFDQEVYSIDNLQAYNNGEDYFYNVYWKKTLENVKYMLKPGKWFGLNVINYPRMLEMAKDEFGEVVEVIELRTQKSHLNKVASNVKEKFEPIYMFKNDKP